MLLFLIAGCGGPAWGTWMFTREYTLPTGEECGSAISHNFVGAYEPAAAEEDTAWVEADTGDVSADVFFGRLEEVGDGAALVLGTVVLPGARQEDGSWLFYWVTTSDGTGASAHVSGYAWEHVYSSSSTLRVAGTFDGPSFLGTHETESKTSDRWDESDTWSEEAAVYVGENGETPAGDYLLVIDQDGAETAAGNSREAYDCGESGCTLSVTTTCAYRYVLTGVRTDFEPSDAGWVEDAGQAAGG